MSTRTRPSARGRRRVRKTPLVWLALGAVVVVAAVLAITLGGGEAGQTAAVDVRGEGLPPLTETGAGDAAFGAAAPRLSGTGTDGEPMTIEPGGRSTVILFLAHWCPVCQEEVPKVQEWLDAGGLPQGVQFVSVATATDTNRPNHPPAEWLEREGWTLPTLLDDGASGAAEAYGLTAFPFWAFLDADGNVVARRFGPLDTDVLGGAMRALLDLEAG
jgi:thiol-disulfide isomerase/thioredoxin